METDIYGMFMTYNQMDYLPYSCDQVDKLLNFNVVKKFYIAEGAHSRQFVPRSPDGSWEYLQERYGGVKEVEIIDGAMFQGRIGYVKAQWKLLQHMLNLIPKPCWYLVLHDDQFMTDEFMKSLPFGVDTCHDRFDLIIPKTLEFAFNFKLYWNKSAACFLNKIYKDSKWFPISLMGRQSTGTRYLKVPQRIKIVGEGLSDTRLFHMGVAMKRRERIEQRVALAAEKGSAGTRDYWYQHMFLEADLNNLDPTYEKGRLYFGEPGFYKDSLDNKSPAIVQKLSVYDGPYPEVLQGHPYMDIKDIRTIP